MDEILSELARVGSDGTAARRDRVRWLRRLVAWLAAQDGGRRLAELSARLRTDDDAARRLREAVGELLSQGDVLKLLAESGVVERSSLAEEALVRLVARCVAQDDATTSGRRVLSSILSGAREAAWLSGLTEESLADFLEAAGLASSARTSLFHAALADALQIHSLRVASIGLAPDVRRALGWPPVAESPFRTIAAAGMRLFDAERGSAADAVTAAAARDEIELAVAAARGERDLVYAHIEDAGVSSDMVRRLDVLGRSLERIADALPLIAPREGERPAAASARVVLRVAADVARDAGFARVVSDRMRLVAKKVVERCGATGAHYITVGRAEWWDMLRRGAGGGLIVAFVVWAKVTVTELHPPPGTLTLLLLVNYAAGFLVIYALHLTLATKQPSMTAAALADAIARGGEGRDPRPVVTIVQRICRSQIAGLAGNVAAVAAASLVLDMMVRSARGASILTPTVAAETLSAHRPFESGCLAFAFVTGVALWLSSMTSGWAENAAAHGRLRESIGDRRGPVAWIARNIGGVTGNVTLAILLALVGFTGKVFDAPFDVRHVTVSTGQVALACSAEGGVSRDAAWAIVGVGMIGTVNLVTGFVLAYWIAARSRGVRARVSLRLVPALAASFSTHPLRFLLPVAEDEERDGPVAGSGGVLPSAD